jgi:hypothetical protein
MSRSMNDSFTWRSRIMPEALDPSYIKVDERTLGDLMIYAGKYSSLVNYYDAANKHTGQWDRFFAEDQDVLLASLLQTNLDQYEACYYKWWSETESTQDFDKKYERLGYLFEITLEIPRRLDMLYAKTTRGQKEIKLVSELRRVIEENLRAELARLLHYAKAAGDADALGKPVELKNAEFSSLWDTGEKTEYAQVYTGTTGTEKINSALGPIGDIFESFVHTLRYISTQVDLDLETVLLERDDHKPHMALYITFLKLFAYAQAELNTITQRHLDLYYNEVLQQKPLHALPDKAIICMELTPGAGVYLLPAGTRLLAGKTASGAPRAFTTDNDIYLNNAAIASLRNIFVSSSPLISYGSTQALVNNIYLSANPAAVPGASWATLGEEQLALGDAHRTMASASIGFAFSSPAFILTEGEREVTLTIRFDQDGFSALTGIAKQIGANEYRSAKDVIIRVFSQGFRIRLSAAAGWMPIDKYLVIPDIEPSSLQLRFHLQVNDDAITGYSPALHGNEYTGQWPVLELLLDENAPVYVYSLLNKMFIQDIDITTEVAGMRKPDIYNNLGQVTPGKPFQAFGPQPVAGSYLLVGKSEMMKKELKSLRLCIGWQDLPPGGFSGYYSGYKMGIANDSFKVKLSVMKNGGWLPAPAVRQSFRLFADAVSGRADQSLAGITVFDHVDISRLRITPRYDLPLMLDPAMMEGFYKVELTDPSFAFASSEYSRVLSDTIAYNVKNKEDLPVPNLPYIPVVSSLTIDYTASLGLQSKDADNTPAIRMFHIHPFGVKEIGSAVSIINNTLVPQYNNEGTLYIGLSGLVPPQPVSIHFQFANGTGSRDNEKPDVQWSYMSNDEWYKLTTDNILSDSTDDLTSSGIIVLDIPWNITSDNTIMQAGLFWIKVSAASSSEKACRTLLVATQAVSVTAASMHDVDAWEPLPAGAIKQFEQNISQVKKIAQPYASFGGASAEAKAEFYQRVSERIRHRQRAINPPDYEQLVMQYFPEVSAAKCLPCVNTELSKNKGAVVPAPGHVMIVVIPASRARKAKDRYPVVNADVLQRIEEMFIGNTAEFMAGREKELRPAYMSPFVKLEVRNPLYERLKVACKVRFKRGYDSSYYIDQMNSDLAKFISPWLFDDNTDVMMAVSIYRSNVLGFIERLPYIDTVASFSIIVIRSGGGSFVLIDSAAGGQYEDEIKAEYPWSLLVSDDSHQIELLVDKDLPGPEMRSIENMIISDDFIITA